MTFHLRFEERLGVDPDEFQRHAFEAIGRNESVLVAAPTGSGKTLVGLAGCVAALEKHERAFYTTPLKALSNQKYHEFAKFFGADRVGLLTGDNAINPEAPVVVMTTEVLRNMIYASPENLTDLGLVVLDEVHYLQNPYRGAVWEEVIIHLDRRVRLVCLSATVSNVDDFARWMRTVRGQMSVIESRTRPVPLEHKYVYTLRRSHEIDAIPVLVGHSPNARGRELDPPWLSRGRRSHGPRAAGVRHPELVEYLGTQGDLPAICFIFSRAGCEAAATEIALAGPRLTSSAERAEIRALIDERLESLSGEDLVAVGYPAFVTQLEAGVAPHHAGMFPPFREIVEACFERSLLKVVFATETLSLGINMPARSVVIDRTIKFNGESHQVLTAGEYTQFSGRAGRRGIDTRGTGYVVWGPGVTFDEVAGMVVGEFAPITSSFRPTYNMTANLAKRYDAQRARELLNLSFAQFGEDAEVVRLEAQLRRMRARGGQGSSGKKVEAAPDIEPGTVLSVPGEGEGQHRSYLVVSSVSKKRYGDTRVTAVSGAGRLYTLWPAQMEVARVHSRLEWNKGKIGGQASTRREASRLLRRVVGSHGLREPSQTFLARQATVARDSGQLARLQERLAMRRGSLAAQLDRITALLEEVDVIKGWSLTERGWRLSHVYCEADLGVVLFLESVSYADLGPAELAAVCSWFTFESRPTYNTPEAGPTHGILGELFDSAREIITSVHARELAHEVPLSRDLAPGFTELILDWALGDDLERVLAGFDIPPGDFVRNVKQVWDLLRQIQVIYPRHPWGDLARRSERAIVRGVVAVATEVDIFR